MIPEFEQTRRVRSHPRIPFISNVPSTVNDEDSTNWSGVVIYAPPGNLISRAVAAQWNVPSPRNVTGGNDHCAVWVGIDGDGSSGEAFGTTLLQAGIETEVGSSGTLNCYAWWEWFSQSHRVSETIISNLLVVPGTDFETQIWVTSETTASLYMFTDAPGQDALTTVLLSISAPPGVQLFGRCAEWIVERPTSGNAVTSLADYGRVVFNDAMAWAASNETLFAGSGTLITMHDDSSGSVISSAQILSRERVACVYG